MQLLFHCLLRARPFLTQHGALPRFIASKGTPRRLSTPTFGKAQAPTNEPQWSSGTNESTKKEALGLISGEKWSLSTTRMGIEREFKFKTFAKTMEDSFSSTKLQTNAKSRNTIRSGQMSTTRSLSAGQLTIRKGYPTKT